VCLLYVLLWFYVLFGLGFYEHFRCEDMKHPGETPEENFEDTGDDCSMNLGTFLLLLLSLYWTVHVIINFLRVMVAGVMATFLWAKDDARGCCSLAIWGSIFRGLTYSFGSICFGSLVQGAVSVLRWIISSGRKNRDETSSDNLCCGGLCFCIVDCLVNLGGDLLDYFSQWNFIYIALYGFSYVESGKAVMNLFEMRNWHLTARGSQSIITERLTSYVLGCVTFCIGIITGASVLIIERIITLRNPDPEFESYVFGPLPHWRIFAFLTGFLIGSVVSSIMMHVVKGAVNTLIVCWADNPKQLKEEHPELARKLRDAWEQAFPNSTPLDPPMLYGDG